MRKRNLSIVLPSLSAALFTLTALPAGAAAQGGAVAQMDGNGDGVISEQEWMDSAKARFDRLDANHDGALDSQELQHARDNLRQSFRNRWEQRRDTTGTAP
jgi:hypothetical protein